MDIERLANEAGVWDGFCEEKLQEGPGLTPALHRFAALVAAELSSALTDAIEEELLVQLCDLFDDGSQLTKSSARSIALAALARFDRYSNHLADQQSKQVD